MRRRTKAIIAVVVILVITIPVAFVVISLLTPPEVEPFSLDDAPQEILDLRSDLKSKLDADTFTWADIPDYLTFCQYVADNAPQVQDLIEGKELTYDFDIGDEGHVIYVLSGGELTMEASSSSPTEPDITITMEFEVLLSLIRLERTAIAAFQTGDLDFDGPLGEALNINQVIRIFNATLMGESIGQVESDISIQIAVNDSGSYRPGLTLLPVVDINFTNESASMGTGQLLVVDHNGEVVAQLENTLHNVHKLINSTTVLMGGAGGTLELWNYKNGAVQSLPIPAGHHAFDYNPTTDTFMILENDYSEEMWDGKYVLYDILSEYDRNGNLIWQWDAREEYPFNATIHTSLGVNETYRAGADWMHCNSFVWDKDENIIYLNVRNHDTIFKIDCTTNEILWKAGRWGTFTVLTKNGTEVDTLWHHPHALEWLGGDRFIFFDNNLYNPNIPSTMNVDNATGYSGFVEFRIDEGAEVVQETWSWYAMNESYYFPESGGDADRLPDGNTIGLFGNRAVIQALRDTVIVTEVTRDGQIAWELRLPGGSDTYYWVHRLERFYEAPLVEVHEQDIDTKAGTIWLNISVWQSYKENAESDGTIRVLVDGVEVYEEPVQFEPQWQASNLVVDIDEILAGFTQVEFVVENEDGASQSIFLLDQATNPLPANWLPVLALLSGIIVAFPALYYWKTRRTKTVRT